MKFENWNEFNELENEINDIIDKQITRYIAFLSNLRAGTIKNLHFTMASLCFEPKHSTPQMFYHRYNFYNWKYNLTAPGERAREKGRQQERREKE